MTNNSVDCLEERECSAKRESTFHGPCFLSILLDYGKNGMHLMQFTELRVSPLNLDN